MCSQDIINLLYIWGTELFIILQQDCGRHPDLPFTKGLLPSCEQCGQQTSSIWQLLQGQPQPLRAALSEDHSLLRSACAQ